MIDIEDCTDELAIENVHVYSLKETKTHILNWFPLLVCPCKPEVEMEENGTLIIHRRTQ